jgi:uncharacterized Zn finger protein
MHKKLRMEKQKGKDYLEDGKIKLISISEENVATV